MPSNHGPVCATVIEVYILTYVHHSNNVLCVDMYVRMYAMYCVWIRTYVMYCIMFLRNVVCVDVHTYVMYCVMFVRNVVIYVWICMF